MNLALAVSTRWGRHFTVDPTGAAQYFPPSWKLNGPTKRTTVRKSKFGELLPGMPDESSLI